MSVVRRGPPADTALLRRLRGYLNEDRASRDLTTRTVVPPGTQAQAVVRAQACGVVSGVAVVRALLEAEGLRPQQVLRDGSRVRPGSVLLRFQGDASKVLSVERTVLNLLTHLSGVATSTRKAVDTARRARPGFVVAATRKTLPGLRDLEKAAVVHGGGHPHRRDLSSSILIKNNHLALVPLDEAVRRARKRVGPRGTVMTEVRSYAQAASAVRAGADQLLFDNVSPRTARRWVRSLEREGLREGVLLEVSGGIRPDTVGAYARTGVDRASLGYLTHSAPALPLHLTVTPLGRGVVGRPHP
jgi:nicotinate-nucleotide pyrophosphorylase (carboxylating)